MNTDNTPVMQLYISDDASSVSSGYGTADSSAASTPTGEENAVLFRSETGTKKVDVVKGKSPKIKLISNQWVVNCTMDMEVEVALEPKSLKERIVAVLLTPINWIIEKIKGKPEAVSYTNGSGYASTEFRFSEATASRPALKSDCFYEYPRAEMSDESLTVSEMPEAEYTRRMEALERYNEKLALAKQARDKKVEDFKEGEQARHDRARRNNELIQQKLSQDLEKEGERSKTRMEAANGRREQHLEAIREKQRKAAKKRDAAFIRAAERKLKAKTNPEAEALKTNISELAVESMKLAQKNQQVLTKLEKMAEASAPKKGAGSMLANLVSYFVG